MVGKFLDKTYIKGVDSLTNKMRDNIKNPYYTFTEKAPSLVTYYNLNTDKSTLDEGTQQAYGYIDTESPFRYNKIEDFLIFGLNGQLAEVNLNAGDFGVESDPIEGTAYIMPNMIKPFPQDYFKLNHMLTDAVFKITNVSLDTFEDGSNVYKIDYRLSAVDDDDTNIDNLVVENFKTIGANIGTNYAVVIKSEDYDVCKDIEDTLLYLKTMFRSLFYSDKTQTFIYTFNDINFYDPYMIQFLMNNQIVDSPELQYIHIDHCLYPGTLFPVEYTKTMFYSLETKDIEHIQNPAMSATLIEDQTSVLSTFIEPYYRVHFHKMGAYADVPTFDEDIIRRIKDKDPYTDDTDRMYRNILIYYFNNIDLDNSIIDVFRNLDYNLESNELFYYIPAAIYIMEQFEAKKLEKLHDET